MKLRGKIYDSSESINRLIKITNSFHHYNNLKKIRERKPLYINNFNNMKNKKSSQSNFGLNNHNNNENKIIINSIEKKKYKGQIKNFEYFEIKKENKDKKYRRKNNTHENNKNNNYSKQKNNKMKLFLPPIKNYQKY